MKQKLNGVIMTLAGALLIVAAALKIHEVLNVYIPSWTEKGVWESWEFYLGQIPVEMALGIWMVSGLFRKASWLAGIFAYGLFIVVTLHKILIGAASCGCFGQVEVNPWITLLAIDVPFLILLLIFRPVGKKLLPPPWPDVRHAIATAVPVFGVLILTGPLLVAFRPEFIKAGDWAEQKVGHTVDAGSPPEGSEVEGSEVIKGSEGEEITAPETDTHWTDETNRWPWLEYIDIGNCLTDGLVVVYMYHHDCSVCAEVIPLYEAYTKEMAEIGNKDILIAYVAIPPYGPLGGGPVPPTTTNPHGRLTDELKWAVASPFVVALFDGSVVKVWPQGTAPNPHHLLEEIFGE